MHLRGVATPMISANKPYRHHHHIYINLLTCAVESYPTPGDINDSISPTPPTP